MSKNKDSVKRELAEASKSVDKIAKTMAHVKACKATYVLESKVRTIEDGQTIVKSITTYHTTKKDAVASMADQYKEVTGAVLTGHDDFVRFESDDGSVVAMFDLYKAMVG